MYRVALVGHSQVPQTVEVDAPNVTVEVYRAPGGKIRTFFSDDRLNGILQKEFELVILWLGSNDIKEASKVGNIVEHIRKVVETVQATCRCEIRICMIEHRIITDHYARRVEQETYDKVAKAINNKLNKKLTQDRKLSFNAKPYAQDLAHDGVHFNRTGRSFIYEKLMEDLINFSIGDLEDFLHNGAEGLEIRKEEVVTPKKDDTSPEQYERFKWMSQLEQEVERTKEALELLLRNKEEEKEIRRPVRSLIKPRDIRMLNLSDLQGIEAEGRLKLFFSQVESCSEDL
ncbi:hypothetical protein GWK47_015517 [Chionoecetes opilio]|uniref:Uncharacterized protein n=1 Tax=Chionoecetes opilio TaxID=41210 RepID=A0A8J4XX91_CHIOP|nr:hypothetical protein GWK47_015517 [Chionoecetes opilio]